MAKVVTAGLAASSQEDLSACAATVFAFFFQVRSVSMKHLRRKDVVLDATGVTVSIFRRKGRSVRRPLLLRYPMCETWPAENPIDLMDKWISCFHDPAAGMQPALGDCMQRSLEMVNERAPAGCRYTSHSARIGGYNELHGLGFAKEWIMRRLDWENEAMLRVYLDSTVIPTDHSRWFFALLRNPRCAPPTDLALH